jgi:hypothetical protein
VIEANEISDNLADLALRVRRSRRGDEPRIERGFAAFGCNQQHVVHVRTDLALGNALGAGRQELDDPLKRQALRALDDLRPAPVNSRASSA